MTRLMRKLLRLGREEHGTATFEATLVLPLMAVCWFAAWYQFDVLESRLDAAEQARKAAWQMSYENCKGEVGNQALIPSDPNTSKTPMAFLKTLCDVPILGEIVGSLLGYSFNAQKESEPFERPKILGGGKQVARSSYFILCNEEKMDFLEVLGNVACKQLRKLNLDFDFVMNCPDDRHADVKDFCSAP